jgi:hypothetical protein
MSLAVYAVSKIQKQSVSHMWRTSIQADINGGEKRSALFTWPRVNLENEMRFISTSERNFIRSFLYKSLSDTWGVPLVHDMTRLTSQADAGQKILTVGGTDYRHFYEGRQCIIVDKGDWSDYEICTIDTIDSSTQITLTENLANTWSSYSKVYPLYECRIGESQEIDIQFKQYNTLLVPSTETYEDDRDFTYSVPESGADTYNGLDLFLFRSLYPITESFKHSYELMSFLGKNTSFTTYPSTTAGSSGTFRVVSRSEIWSLFKFFDSKMGRFISFYLPTWDSDIVPTAAIDSTDQTITIEESYMDSDDMIGKHVYIRFPDGTYTCREITAFPSITSITLDSAIGKSVSLAQLSRLLICFLYEVRFDTDELLMEYTADEIAETKLSFLSV